MRGLRGAARYRVSVAGDIQTLNVTLTVHGKPLRLSCSVPSGAAELAGLLPMARSLSDELVRRSIEAAESDSVHVSCKAHCGACCRQLVPVSPVEARAVTQLIEEMPEPRRSTIRGRFSAIEQSLQANGLFADLSDPSSPHERTPRQLGLEYFALGMACPFLEDESCSIYADRPVACREYLVTSPAHHCAAPTAEAVSTVPMAAKVSHALHGFAASDAAAWVPLSLAPQWCAAHPAPTESRTGPELLRQFFQGLLDRPLPQ